MLWLLRANQHDQTFLCMLKEVSSKEYINLAEIKTWASPSHFVNLQYMKYTTLRVWGRTSSVPESASDISLLYLRCTQESRDNCRPCQPHGDAWGFGIQFLAPKTRHQFDIQNSLLTRRIKGTSGDSYSCQMRETCTFFLAFSWGGWGKGIHTKIQDDLGVPCCKTHAGLRHYMVSF